MSNLTVKDDTSSQLDQWMQMERDGVQFPVPFESAWRLAGYSTKANAKRQLVKLQKDVDYQSSIMMNTNGGKPFEDLRLSCDTLKHFCLMAGTSEGRAIRDYFIECEKKWRLTQQIAPQVAEEVELMQLKIELAKLESQKEAAIASGKQAELQLVQFRHIVTTTMPEPLQQKILGYSEIKTVEYVDRTILPDGKINDGVGITYIQKRYGFKSTKEAWGWLESVGIGKFSDKWKHELKAVESSVLPRDYIAELDAIYDSTPRQRWLGE